jgi:hypothetical protein
VILTLEERHEPTVFEQFLESVMHFGPGAVCSGHDNRNNEPQTLSERCE